MQNHNNLQNNFKVTEKQWINILLNNLLSVKFKSTSERIQLTHRKTDSLSFDK